MPNDSEEADDEGGDDLCDICFMAGVTVGRTTYCGKTIGIECGCEAMYEDGTCVDDSCEVCLSQVPPALCEACGVAVRNPSAVGRSILVRTGQHVCCVACADTFCFLCGAHPIGLLGEAAVCKMCHRRNGDPENILPDEVVIPLQGGCSLRCGAGERYLFGGYLRICDPAGEELYYWQQAEWIAEPEEVIGGVFGTVERLVEEYKCGVAVITPRERSINLDPGVTDGQES